MQRGSLASNGPKRARVSLTLRLICGYLLRSLLPFLTCIYDTLLDLEIYRLGCTAQDQIKSMTDPKRALSCAVYLGALSHRREDCHSAAPPSPSSTRFNRDDEGAPRTMTELSPTARSPGPHHRLRLRLELRRPALPPP